MARCKNKRKVRTKIASHFRNVWKCMDKKILKPLKKADFALPAAPKRPARKRPHKRARPLPPEEEAPAAAVIAPALDEIVEAPVLDEAPVAAPLGLKARKERRRARQFRREEFPMKELRVKLKKLPPLPKGRENFPIKLIPVARGTKTKKPKKELQIKLKKLPHLPGGKARLPSNFDYSRLDRKKPATVEVGERLRVKLPGISKKLKAIKGTKNVPID